MILTNDKIILLGKFVFASGRFALHLQSRDSSSAEKDKEVQTKLWEVKLSKAGQVLEKSEKLKEKAFFNFTSLLIPFKPFDFLIEQSYLY